MVLLVQFCINLKLSHVSVLPSWISHESILRQCSLFQRQCLHKPWTDTEIRPFYKLFLMRQAGTRGSNADTNLDNSKVLDRFESHALKKCCYAYGRSGCVSLLASCLPGLSDGYLCMFCASMCKYHPNPTSADRGHCWRQQLPRALSFCYTDVGKASQDREQSLRLSHGRDPRRDLDIC